MIRYYCSGFDANDAFGHGLGKMFKQELKDTKSIVYIPGGFDNPEKIQTKYLPNFTNYFKNVGIEFETVNLITPNLSQQQAQEICENASFVLLMGGCPFKQKQLCEQLGIIQTLKKYQGILLGCSAGAMLMSKHIIITPCSEEYPNFRIEDGLNLDGISIYPHNNTSDAKYPDVLISGDETYKKADLITVANQYGLFYLLQDNLRSDGKTDVSFIKSSNGKIEFYHENDGKIWIVDRGVHLMPPSKALNHRTRLRSQDVHERRE